MRITGGLCSWLAILRRVKMARLHVSGACPDRTRTIPCTVRASVLPTATDSNGDSNGSSQRQASTVGSTQGSSHVE